MSPAIREELLDALELKPDEGFEVDGLLDLNDLWEIVRSSASRTCAIRRGRP